LLTSKSYSRSIDSGRGDGMAGFLPKRIVRSDPYKANRRFKVWMETPPQKKTGIPSHQADSGNGGSNTNETASIRSKQAVDLD
jgi:hypothetical protein